MVPNQFDNIDFDRRVVAAHFHGRLEQLLSDLHRAGHTDVQMTDLVSRAEVLAEMWRLGDPEKPTCYGCRSPVAPGRLCDCYEEVTPGRLRNVNDPKLLAALDPGTLIEVYSCVRCGELDGMSAQAALEAHQRFGSYRAHKFCRGCFLEQKGEPRTRGRRGRRQKPQQPQPAGKVTETVLEAAAQAVVSAQA